MRLKAAGLLDVEHRLEVGTLPRLGSQLPAMKGAAPLVAEAPWDAEEVTVLRRFFEGTRLTQIPAHSKRLVILERLVQEVEPGMLYGVLNGCELVAGGW